MNTVIMEYWLESESGWGTRPDGISIHLTKTDSEWYIRDYWDSMPNYVPDEYSRPTGKSELVEVPEDTYQQLKALKAEGTHGMRFWQHNLPDWAKKK